MSNKCLVLIISFAFVGVTFYTLILGPVRYGCREESTRDPTPENDRLPSMDLSKAFKPGRVLCDLTQDEFQLPSLEHLIHALASKENPGISSISGLALYFNLNNACQPLGDVSKASVQVYKFAFVTLVNKTACPLQRLALNAQNTGYAVLVHLLVTRYLDTHNKYKLINLPETIPSEEKVVIPVAATAGVCRNESTEVGVKTVRYLSLEELTLSKTDRTIVEITVPLDDLDRNELKKMERYLYYLFLWMFVGPLVYFVVWIRSSGRQPNQQRGNGVETAAEMETRFMEEGELNTIEHRQLHSLATEETVTNTHTENEMQPLLNGVRYYGSNTRQRGCIIIRKCFCKVLVGSLVDVKLTALRTAAIGLTLGISFNSSMHIIRKLWKPQESLFEGLGEK